MNAQNLFGIIAIFYCIANLGSMGLEVDLKETFKSIRNVKLISLTLFWSWVVSPLLAILIVWVLPLSVEHANGLLLFSLAPTAPMLPLLIRKAKADMNISAALMPMAVAGTVILMPILAPILIKGSSVSSVAVAKQLILTVLLPLVAGMVVNGYRHALATKLLPWFKKLANISTLALLAFTIFIYGKELLGALGSFAVAAQVLFVVIIAFGAYSLGFGMKQAERSALSLAICSRNGGAMFVAFTTFPVQNPDVMVMLLLAVPVPVIVWLILARWFASRAEKEPVSY